MKKWLLLAVVMTLATTALADNVTLQLVGTPFGQIGPYDMTVNGGSAQPLVCGSALQFITLGESWTAAVYNINTITSNPWLEFNQTQAQWNEAALFADLLFSHPGDAALQNDVWAALGMGGVGYDSFWAPIVHQFLLDNPLYLTPDVFYIPVEADYSGPDYQGLPQPFIGTPEPSSLMLFGSGLMLAAGVVRRKLRA